MADQMLPVKSFKTILLATLDSAEREETASSHSEAEVYNTFAMASTTLSILVEFNAATQMRPVSTA
jgi:hypothetical protein